MYNISYGILKIPGKQCRGVVIEVLDHYMQQPWRARWGNKVIEQGRTICSTLTAGGWTIGPCPQAVLKPKIWWEIDVNISRASWCQCWPIFYFQGYIYSEKLYKLSNPQCSFPPGYHHGLCSVQPKQVTQAAFGVPIYHALITFDITWWNIYSFA